MMNLKSLIFVAVIALATACGNSSTGEVTTVKVKELEQVAGYTYLLVKSKGPEYWVAVPTMDASPGETYHYQGGMVMQDFYSKELDRVFDEVIFLEAIFADAGSVSTEVTGQMGGTTMGSINPHGSQDATPGSKAHIEKTDVFIEAGEGCLKVSELYANPASFEGKTIRVKGKVTKYNPAIMERNWVHIQDGTEHEGKFDLTITSAESFVEGTIVTVEGILALNKDFGYGYSYEILVENAKVVQ